jgi:uncharacterized OB-fold protein
MPNDTEDFAELGAGGTLKNVEIFSAGTWRGSREVKVDGAMLDRMVANFSNLNSKVSGFGVPIKLGHNDRIGEPAYGWMSDVQRVGDTLVADFADVDPQIVDAISKRRYNSVSVEIYPVVKYAGQVLNDVLGGVALLGAEWPAVKGLKPLSASLFSEQPEKVELKEKSTVTTFTEDQMNAEKAVTAAEKTRADNAVAKLSETEAKLAAAEAKLAAAEEAGEKAEIAAVIKAAEDKGQITPANKQAVEEFAEKVRTAATGEARKALLATFKGFVEAMPAKVKFGEQGRSESTEVDGQSAAAQVDAKVKAHMAASKTSDYAVAFAAVMADPANADLKTAYAQEM